MDLLAYLSAARDGGWTLHWRPKWRVHVNVKLNLLCIVQEVYRERENVHVLQTAYEMGLHN